MPNSRKHLLVRKSGLFSLVLSFFISSTSFVILKSSFNALLVSFIFMTVTAANVLNVGYRNFASMLRTKINTELFSNFSIVVDVLIKYVGSLFLAACFFHLVAVAFGAYFFESFWSTLYFSCFMTVLTVYPLILYCWLDCGMFVNLLDAFMESRYDGSTEGSLNLIAVCSIVGAWLGAFLIPLDWDREWQEWPTTCCVGAALGNAAAHGYLGFCAIWNTSRKNGTLCGISLFKV